MIQLATLGHASVQLNSQSGYLDLEAGIHGGRMGALTLKEAGDLMAALAIGFATMAERKRASVD